ncbi:CRISPR-associated exonuclease Cas4 [Candidatus Kryptonium thompsonii]|uniref:CRISPR-associated exonuclease Cas4 n=1 Tax=Candidatus Kryptonium thompsonii TaxID=1633631 RepID=A0ABP2AWD5_9BACT|nr:CRISPR-associated protein Cas4 [Candidatus Kryptonium thompsoni]CUS89951.1 CRISPR-associated exonuclease Cas4 [Candidatus Kryptonium thompsoni]
MELFEHVKYTGTMVNYYFVCKRKLWLFAHNLNFESESDMVKIGKLISQTSYEREDKEIDIDQTIVIDWIDFENKIIHEVKKSNKLEEAHIWQVKYYIYYLETRKAVGFKGMINYPKLHKREIIELKDEDREKLRKVLEDIKAIVSSEKAPEKVRIPTCKSCSYFEFCWV